MCYWTLRCGLLWTRRKWTRRGRPSKLMREGAAHVPACIEAPSPDACSR
uniref:Uncharacterized protein n=1 Tax=Arundo donax TaxID=35708 RepID=A0A0A9BP59_ARUDO